jgi:hypothetical protein
MSAMSAPLAVLHRFGKSRRRAQCLAARGRSEGVIALDFDVCFQTG